MSLKAFPSRKLGILNKASPEGTERIQFLIFS